jgi:hypothetical protein
LKLLPGAASPYPAYDLMSFVGPSKRSAAGAIDSELDQEDTQAFDIQCIKNPQSGTAGFYLVTFPFGNTLF